VIITNLDDLRERLQRALDKVDEMTAATVAERTELKPGTYSIDHVGIERATDLADAMCLADYLDPVEVTGWPAVQRFWAVRVPVTDDEGCVEGDEVVRFGSKAGAGAPMSRPPRHRRPARPNPRKANTHSEAACREAICLPALRKERGPWIPTGR
jgi:hypothetical protein